jgi:oligogalacturonide lyase
VDSPEPLADPLHRQRRASLLYRRGDEWWLANYDGSQNHRLRIPAGTVATPQWSPDGRSILYAAIPSEAGEKTFIREFFPDTNEDRAVAATSRYIGFDTNADATVFAGASGSKAAPHILLLLRSVRRELTVCEHKASDARMATPAFSPNSQRLLFTSDQHGKSAIYAMNIERLVEET